MCGLTGYIPKNEKSKPNMDWIKLILSYNAERGNDSCGFYINGKVEKSLGCVKDYISENKISVIGKNKTIIVHNRKSSKGAVSLLNAHPFVISNDNKTMIIEHNGTIHNIEEMAKKRNFDTKGMFVDSLILGHLMLNYGYEVLSEYNGGAALLWAFEDEPNVMYAFKGASKIKENTKDIYEERPLCLLKDKTGLYFSSLSKPLKVIAEENYDIKMLAENCVYRFEKDDIQIIYKVDRSKSYQEKVYVSYQSNFNWNNNYDYQNFKSEFDEDKVKTSTTTDNNLFSSTEKQTVDLIDNIQLLDEMPNKVGTCFVGLRCFNLTKEYLYTPFEHLPEDLLLNGYQEEINNTLYPTSKETNHYYYEGIRIRVAEIKNFINNYLIKIDKMGLNEKYITLSRMTYYPICFLPKEIKGTTLCFYKDGVEMTESNNVSHTAFRYNCEEKRLYRFNKGRLLKIVSDDVNDIIFASEQVECSTTPVKITDEIWLERDTYEVLEEANSREIEKMMILDPFSTYIYPGVPEFEFDGRDVLFEVIKQIVEEFEVKVWNTESDLDEYVEDFIDDAIESNADLAQYIKNKYDIELNEKICEFLSGFVQ